VTQGSARPGRAADGHVVYLTSKIYSGKIPPIMDTPVTEHPHDAALVLWRALLRTTSAMGHELRQDFARLGSLTGAQWGVLRVLGEGEPGGAMLSDISQQLSVSCGNTTGVVDRLEEAGYVQRSSHPDDRRAVLAVLTDAGRALYETIAPVHREHVAALLGVLDADEQSVVTEALKRIADHVAVMKANDAV
jgi:DNA-binding MarR family transcriptional regulator